MLMRITCAFVLSVEDMFSLHLVILPIF
jgi:hypothetical protein